MQFSVSGCTRSPSSRPAFTVSPVSSRASRTAAVSGLSLGSILPPGRTHGGAPSSTRRRASKTLPWRTMTATATARRSGSVVESLRVSVVSVVPESCVRRVGLARTSVLAHVWITVVGRRHERLLDRTGGDPADEVEHRAGLVVGAARPGAAERLLADDRAGRLVVDVEVAGGVPQAVRGIGDRGAVGGQDRAGQRVRGGVGGLAEHRGVLGV